MEAQAATVGGGPARHRESPSVALPPGASVGLSFSAGGLLFPYYIGVASALQDNGIITESTHMAGTSAGAILVGCMGGGIGLDEILECNKSMYAELENHGTIGRIRPVLRRSILEALPRDAHLRASGRITIAVT